MRWHAQLLSAHSADSSPSLLLSFDTARYLFNAGEGIQRIAISEHKKNLTGKLRNVFVTRLDWGEAVGGIPGLLLTLAAGIEQPAKLPIEKLKRKAETSPAIPRNTFTIHGPENVTDFFLSTRHFVYRYTVNVNTNELNKFRRFLAVSSEDSSSGFKTGTSSNTQIPKPLGSSESVIFEDSNITVKAFELLPKSFVANENENEALDAKTIHSDTEFQTFAMKKLGISRMTGGTSTSESGHEGASQKRAPGQASEMMCGGVENPSSEPPNPPPEVSSKYPNHQSPLELAQSLFVSRQHPQYNQRGYFQQTSPCPPSPRKPSSLAYLVTAATYPGKFDAEAARRLGVAPGEDYKRLQKGECVKVRLENGKAVEFVPTKVKLSKSEAKKRAEEEKQKKDAPWGAEGVDWRWVRAEEVVGESRGGGMLLLIDLPATSYIDPLLSHPVLSPILSHPPSNLHAIVHFIHPSVLDEPLYQQTVRHLAEVYPNLRNIICSRRWSPGAVTFGRAQDIAYKLSQLDDQVFRPAWTEPGISKEEEERELEALFGQGALGAISIGKPLLKLNMEPPGTFDETEIPRWFKEGVVGPEIEEQVEESKEAIKAFKEQCTESQTHKNVVEKLQKLKPPPLDRTDEWQTIKELVVVALGTGASLPSKYRNVSSTLLIVPSTSGPPSTHLFDTGENTYGQILRHFGPVETTRVLASLRMLSTARAEVILCNFLEDYNEVQDLGLDSVVFISNEEISARVGPDARKRLLHSKGFREGTGLTDIVAVPVKHCPSAFAMVVKGERAQILVNDSGERNAGLIPGAFMGGVQPLPFLESREFKFVFSGDCRPSDHLAYVGRDATVLVHEATFEDALIEEAIEKSHCTVGEAVQVAEKMAARNLLLTHFSQRYPKVPTIAVHHADFSPMTGVAFDMMRVRVSDFSRLEKMMKGGYLDKLVGEEKSGDADEFVEAEDDVANDTGTAEGDKDLTRGLDRVSVADHGLPHEKKRKIQGSPGWVVPVPKTAEVPGGQSDDALGELGVLDSIKVANESVQGSLVRKRGNNGNETMPEALGQPFTLENNVTAVSETQSTNNEEGVPTTDFANSISAIESDAPKGFDKHWTVWLVQVTALFGGVGACYAMYQRMRGAEVLKFTKYTIYGSVFQGSVLALLLLVFTLTNPLPPSDELQYSEGYYTSLQSCVLSLAAATALGLDWIWTEQFEENGSGLSRAQGRLAVMVAWTVLYTSLLSLVYHLLEGWPYPLSLFFVLSTITTIGFGLPSPSSTVARVLTIPIGTVGVALMGYTVSHTVEVIQEGVREGVRLRWKARRSDGEYVRVSGRTPEEEAIARAGGGWLKRTTRTLKSGWRKFVNSFTRPADYNATGGAVFTAEADFTVDGDGDEEVGVVVMDATFSNSAYAQVASGDSVSGSSWIKKSWTQLVGKHSFGGRPLEMVDTRSRDGFEPVGLKPAHLASAENGEMISQETLVDVMAPEVGADLPSKRPSHPPHLLASLFALLALLLSTAYVFSQYEDWPYLDSLYFVWASFLTIGYGDIVPRTAGGLAFFNVVVGAAIGLVTWAGSLLSLWWDGSWEDKERKHELAHTRAKDRRTKRGHQDEPHVLVAKWTLATLRDGPLGDENDDSSIASSDEEEEEGDSGEGVSVDKSPITVAKFSVREIWKDLEQLEAVLNSTVVISRDAPSYLQCAGLLEDAKRFLSRARDALERPTTTENLHSNDGRVSDTATQRESHTSGLYIGPSEMEETTTTLPTLAPPPPPPTPRRGTAEELCGDDGGDELTSEYVSSSWVSPARDDDRKLEEIDREGEELEEALKPLGTATSCGWGDNEGDGSPGRGD
ncbi:hypothetical protein HDU93_008408 [Gonapodya sp. JEL0774]|nr:hypothetical protein HDU93_008408 [Gonapodya sp. JEL0774]